jgi:hypothetical protein
MTAFAPGRVRLTFGYGSTRSDRSWSRERLESARNGQPTRSDTRSARGRQMAPMLPAEHVVPRVAANRAHVDEPGAFGIRPEPAAMIGSASRRANPPGARARVDVAVAASAEAGVSGVMFS